MTRTLASRAREFAFAAHGAMDHRRKYTNEPCTTHLESVASIVAEVTQEETVIAAAYLHDIVEDTPITIEQLESEFGREVAYLVSHLTDVWGANSQFVTQTHIESETCADWHDS